MAVFDGTVERRSHEGGLLVPFTGPSPALGSVLVDADGQYVGKVDGVLGTTEAPIVHVAHLDRNRAIEDTIGVKLSIRARHEGGFRNDRGRGRDDRRGGRDRFQSNDRGRGNRGGGDWDCPKCNNSNFAFRTECNRCGEPRGDARSKPRDDRRGFGRDRGNDRGRDRFRSQGQGRDDRRGGGDWDCPKCNNSNFSFRTECNRCGEPRGDARGTPRNDRRGGFDRRNNDRRGGFDRRGGRDGNRGGYEAKPGDWTCNDCGANNFASRTSCYKCGPDAQNRGGDRREGDRRGPRFSRGFGGGDRRGGDRRGPREPRNFAGGDRRGPRQDRDFRKEGRGDGDRRGGDRRGPRQDRGNGGKSRIRPKGPFRQARGKSGGHAHNRGPKPIRRTRRDDD